MPAVEEEDFHCCLMIKYNAVWAATASTTITAATTHPKLDGSFDRTEAFLKNQKSDLLTPDCSMKSTATQDVHEGD